MLEGEDVDKGRKRLEVEGHPEALRLAEKKLMDLKMWILHPV